jgi:cytosine/adenosine deaminase-related metal-dependent hydrolase
LLHGKLDELRWEAVSILIKGATILSVDPKRESDPFVADILIEGDVIKEIGANIEASSAEVIEGKDRLVMPGLVNAHVHSWEALFKGRYDNLPLELWMLYSYPILGLSPLPEHLIYLRTMLVGVESLKSGVTCVLDDVLEMPGQSLPQLEAVFRAYEDVGIRANCSGHIINKAFTDTIPYANEVLPRELVAKVNELPPPSTDSYLSYCREAIARFHGRAGRLRYVIAPSGPQRCTDDLLVGADELSRTHGTTYHIHVLETKVQMATGREFYGKTLVRHMHDLGVLNERTTLAHAIWVTDEDIELMADAGCSIAHNAISNQKLGAGIAPLRKLLDAGVNVGLGFDVSIGEIDVAPVQIQGPKSQALMVDLIGEAVRDLPYYGLMEAKVGGRDVIVSQTGFTGEKGYEIYLRDATLHAEDLWEAVLEAGVAHNLMVTAPAHHRRIAAGILSWGQDMDQEVLPFQCNLAYQVPLRKTAPYIGKEKLEWVRSELDAGRYPFETIMVGMALGGRPITDYAPDFWLISDADGGDPVGYVTSPWYSPELQTNIALGHVPVHLRHIGTELKVWLPDEYAEKPGRPVDAEVV